MAATAVLPVKCPICEARIDVAVTITARTITAQGVAHSWDISAGNEEMEQHARDMHPALVGA